MRSGRAKGDYRVLGEVNQWFEPSSVARTKCGVNEWLLSPHLSSVHLGRVERKATVGTGNRAEYTKNKL